jgi:hypothetical protein
MGWRQRLQQLTLAGGMLPLAGCGSGTLGGGIPCGNANPDPCICDRPSMSQEWKAQCDAKTACVNMGGTWHSATATCDADAGTGGAGDGGND